MSQLQPRTSDELRALFLDFFREKDHPVLPGSPLAPHDDPTLLFTTAGMVQFKPYYVAKGSIPYTRAATVQPCFRASDLESVGRTARHQTFFEMLGNFSFGDYFKEEAIAWAWEFSVERLKLPADRIIVTVFEDDDEAWDIWEKKIGVDPKRIARRGAKDNYWGPAGDSGPCGPCSELHIDLRDDRSVPYDLDADGDKILEYWNLVFPQFDAQPDGTKMPLRNRGIDTGMGLERLSLIMQGVQSNYETDLFIPIMETVRGFAKGVDTTKGDGLVATRVMADHARALVFAINEGILPGNEGRGYVLRRILRRSLLRANHLGISDLVLAPIASSVIDRMQTAYPDLAKNRPRILETVKAEEERFRKTLEQGLELFKRVAGDLKKRGGKRLAGEEIFKLYDTYGFPVEITEEMAESEGIELDRAGFEAAMEEQRGRSRWTVEGSSDDDVDWSDVKSTFTGYEHDTADTEIVALVKDGKRVQELTGEGLVVLGESPFYAESGGQVGDTGELDAGGDPVFFVTNTTKGGDDGIPVLAGKAADGEIMRVGDAVFARVDTERRDAIKRNHTATHLLHRALRDKLGTHVHQAGSLVAPDRLRFDFVHHSRTGPDELAEIEAVVNRKIIENIPHDVKVVSFADAQKAGAMALFGEKYGDRVRMVAFSEYSVELCGGTHVDGTGEIGTFLITSEGAVGSGIRRVEAITGEAAYRKVREDRTALEGVAQLLRTVPAEVPARVEAMQSQLVKLEKEIEKARQSVAGDQLGALLDQATDVEGVRVVATEFEGDVPTLRGIVDQFQQAKGEVVAVLGARTNGKAVLVAGVSPAAVKRGLKAGQIIGEVASLVGGRGGGKPAFAQAGGPNAGALESALAQVAGIVKSALEGS